MKRAFLRALVEQRASIKQRWRAVLQAAPTHTPLANPVLLAYMIDETLEELLWEVMYPKASTHRSEPALTVALARSCSGCGLNPYIGYFLAGEAALVGTIKMMEPTSQLTENDILCAETELLFTFRVMSHREVNAFCEICRIERPAARFGNQPQSLPDLCPHKYTAAASSVHAINP